MTNPSAPATSALPDVDSLADSRTTPAETGPETAQSVRKPGPQRVPGRFARLPELAGRTFLPLGLFARLPLAMLTVGTLTLVTSASGSYAIGGTAAGAVGIGSALGAPVLGSLADRSGQRTVLLWSAAANSLAVILLLVVSYLDQGPASLVDWWLVLAAAFAAGASCPQVGPMARVRWMALTTRNLTSGTKRTSVASSRADLDTALAYEGTADEITFVLGPALVGILASMVAPWLPLAIAVLLTITLVPLFAVHPTQRAVTLTPPKASAAVGQCRPGAGASRRDRPRRVGALLPVALPVLAMLFMGSFFGATQTALTAFASVFATAEAAGLLYAVMGLSSAVAALSVAFWPQRFGLGARWLFAAGAMAGFALLLLWQGGLGTMIAVLLLLGVPVGPVMVTVFAIGGIVAPEGRLSTVMTALASGIVAGTAVGSALAGQLAQDHGYAAAFMVSVSAAVALFLLGAASLPLLCKGRQGR
jgi:MFS family permease